MENDKITTIKKQQTITNFSADAYLHSWLETFLTDRQAQDVIYLTRQYTGFVCSTPSQGTRRRMRGSNKISTTKAAHGKAMCGRLFESYGGEKMNDKDLLKFWVLVILVVILLLGCSASDAEPDSLPVTQAPPADTPTPVPPTATTRPTPILPTAAPTADSSIMFVVTFDGEDCYVEGPTELAAGVYSFTFIDNSDMKAQLWIVHLDEGYTTQDLLDGQSEPGEWYPKPSWAAYDTMNSSKVDKSEGKSVRTSTWILDKLGEHTILCYVPSPQKIWMPAGILIKDTDS